MLLLFLRLGWFLAIILVDACILGCFYCVYKVFVFSLAGWCLCVNSVVLLEFVCMVWCLVCLMLVIVAVCGFVIRC